MNFNIIHNLKYYVLKSLESSTFSKAVLVYKHMQTAKMYKTTNKHPHKI